jgi:hypothetical protein
MRFSILIACCLAVCMLAGNASAETQIMIPESSFEDTADLPVIISGITAATGLSFELSYDKDIVRIESITASSEIPGSNVISRVDNDAGYAKVAITNTDGISAEEPAPLALIRLTRVGSGGDTIILKDPRWSDTRFIANVFDVVLDGNIISLETAIPIDTTRSTLDSHVSSSSSAPAATPTPGSTATPVTTATASGATTTLPAPSGDTARTSPAAPGDVAAEDAQPSATPKATLGFCAGTVLVAGFLGIALLLHRRS